MNTTLLQSTANLSFTVCYKAKCYLLLYIVPHVYSAVLFVMMSHIYRHSYKMIMYSLKNAVTADAMH